MKKGAISRSSFLLQSFLRSIVGFDGLCLNNDAGVAFLPSLASGRYRPGDVARTQSECNRHLSKKDFIDYFPFTRQDTKNALYFFLLTQFHKIVKLALKNKTSLLPFHEVLTIYMRQFAHALEKFDETRGFSFWSYANWYQHAANSEIKRICENQSIVSPIENE